jgi:cell division protein FtsB
MQSYKYYQEDLEYEEYLRALDIVLKEQYLDEGFLDNLKGALRSKIDFIKQIVDATGQKANDIVELLKNKKIFLFFSKIAFSFKRVFVMLKKGYQSYAKLQHIIAQYVADTKVVKWTQAELRKLDAFLNKHPIAKKMAGPVVSAILLYIWFNMAFSGDFLSDMAFDDILLALAGKFSLSDIFSGPEGVKLISLFLVGMAGVSFPWPGPTSAHFIGGVIMSLKRVLTRHR